MNASCAIDAGTALVDTIAGIWSRTLRVPVVSPDSDFFELGGDSLLAVNLLLEFEQETGIRLPITAIYDAPTPGKLAALIAANNSPRFSPLVFLKAGENGPPLFIVHGIGGTVLELAAFARKIDIEEPVYALQARGVDGTEAPLESVAAMAEYYIAAIRRIQPQGPYRFCGYSFGGLVALEMARSLEAAGEKVSALVLIDAYPHPATWPRLSRARLRARRALRSLCNDARGDPRRLVRRLVRGITGLPRRRSGPSGFRRWLLDTNPNLPLALVQVREAGETALAGYVPRAFSGSVVFLKAAERSPEFPDDPKRIWGGRVKRMQLRIVAGAHRTIVSEHAPSAAALVSRCIRECENAR